jgi:uncharacterized repeat protein (TIGR01451 family)
MGLSFNMKSVHGCRRAVVGAWAVALSLLVAAPALGATTQVSSFTKSGTDPSTGSTATAGGAAGSANGGDTVNWTLSYRNTAGAPASADLTDVIGTNQTYVPGSLQTPPGMAPRWSTNGGSSYVTSEPGSGVNAVGASGSNIDGSTGGQTLAQPPAGGFTAGSAAGDGWEAIFVGANVYNIHHHRQSNSGLKEFDCHVKATGAVCPGFAGGGTFASQTAGQPFGQGTDTLDTSLQPSAFVDQATGKVYFPAGPNGTNSIGVACIDLTAGTSCGYVQLGTSAFNNGLIAGSAQIDGGAQVGTRYYVMDDQAKLYCFDTSTGAACGAPYPMSPIPGWNGGNPNTTLARMGTDNLLQAFDGRYVFANVAEPNGTRDLVCIDTTTNAACGPGFPVRNYGGTDFNVTTGAGVYSSPLAPLLDANGSVTGICGAISNAALTVASWGCRNLAGQPAANPFPQQVANAAVNWPSFGSIVRIATKVYMAYSPASGVATYTCYDFATNAACAGFVNGSSGAAVAPYTLRQDPQNPDCIWEVGNNGIFEVFSATFGGTSCATTSATVSVTPGAYYCDGAAGHVTGWNQLLLQGVTSADYKGMVLTITDANNNPVPGWINRAFPNTQQTIDISSIPVTGGTGTLHVQATLDHLAAGKSARVVATFSGDPVQVCFKTKVAAGICATARPAPNAANAVTVGSNNVSDAPGGNGSGTAQFSIAPDPSVCRADLEIVKTAPTGVIAGKDTTYDLLVTNHGPDTAQSVVVSDPLPAGLTFVSASSGCTAAGGTVTCTLPSLAVGASTTFHITAHVSPSAKGSISNTATVTSSTPDPNPPNNTSTKKIDLKGATDLSIVKKASVSTTQPGGQVIYTLLVKNAGPSDATGVTVTDPPPAGLTYASASASQGTCTVGAKLSCSLGDLAAGGTAQVLVTASVATSASGALTNTATVTGDQNDPDPSNNTSTAKVNVVPGPGPPAADLEVAKRAGHGKIKLGEQLTYTITVTNHGPGAAPGVELSDTPSVPGRLVSVKPTQGTCAKGSPIVCQLGTIKATGTVTITIVAIPQRAGTVRNAATATSDVPDPNTQNNIARTATIVTPALLLSKTVSHATVRAGQSVTYRLRVGNPSAVAVKDVRVCDDLPAGLAYMRSSAKAKLSRGRYCWTFGSLAGLGSRTIVVTARALGGAHGRLVNHATATGAGTQMVRAARTVRVKGVSVRGGGVTG